MALIEPRTTVQQATEKDDVAKRFSGAAGQYDEIANIQAQIATAALARVPQQHVNKALDIGCGTGRHTQRLGRIATTTTGLDLAAGMVEQAQQNYPVIHFVQGDAEQLPWQSAAFDLVFSSMALQWCRCPQAALAEISRVLHHGGRAELAIMVDGSFAELRRASRAAGVSLQINELFTASDWLAALSQTGLKYGAHELVEYSDEFDGIWQLLRSIKGVGAGSSAQGAKRQGLTRKALNQLETAMPRNEQGQLTNTYTVLHLTLEKPQ